MLKFIQQRLKKYVVSQIDPDYTFQFVGWDAMTRAEELDMSVKKVTNIATLNEVREELGYKKIDDEAADQVMNATFMQFKMQLAAQQQQEQAGQDQGSPEEQAGMQDYPEDEQENPFEQ
jgi:hypothetical protein